MVKELIPSDRNVTVVLFGIFTLASTQNFGYSFTNLSNLISPSKAIVKIISSIHEHFFPQILPVPGQLGKEIIEPDEKNCDRCFSLLYIHYSFILQI